MATNYVADGATIDFTADAAYSSGDPVDLGKLIGVVKDDVASGATGVAHIQGVFTLPKQASLAITQGDIVYFDTTAEEIDKTNTNVLAGICYATAADSDSTVQVLLNVGAAS